MTVGVCALAAAALPLYALLGSSGSRDRAAGAGASSSLVRPAGPIALTSKACTAFAPAGRRNGKTVFLDPGHGGLDTGAIATAAGTHVAEKRVALALALRTLALLRQRGFRVVLARVDDSPVAKLRPGDVSNRLLTAEALHRDVSARNLCANAAKAQVLVGIHLNSFDDPSVSGTETIYNANRSFSARSRRLATFLQRALHSALTRVGSSASDRGVSTDSSAGGAPLTSEAAAYGQLLELGPAKPPWFRYPTRMPGALVEPLFLTNPQDARLALSQAGQAAIAGALVRGIVRFLKPPR